MRAALAVVVLVACAPMPVLEQPNTVQACARANECGIIGAEAVEQCVVCLEHVDQEKLDNLVRQYGPMPEIETAPCEHVSFVIEHTDIGTCIRDVWVWK